MCHILGNVRLPSTKHGLHLVATRSKRVNVVVLILCDLKYTGMVRFEYVLCFVWDMQ